MVKRGEGERPTTSQLVRRISICCVRSGPSPGRVAIPPILAKSSPSEIPRSRTNGLHADRDRFESRCLRDRANYLLIIAEGGRSDPVAGRSTLDLRRKPAPTATAPPPRVAAAPIAAPSLSVFRVFARGLAANLDWRSLAKRPCPHLLYSTIKSFATMISPLKVSAAAACHVSSFSMAGTRCEITSVFTPASAAMRPMSSTGEWSARI
jgi:hypothetical protein